MKSFFLALIRIYQKYVSSVSARCRIYSKNLLTVCR